MFDAILNDILYAMLNDMLSVIYRKLPFTPRAGFINDVTQFRPKINSPSPLCHAKMYILPTPSYRVSQNHLLPPFLYLHDVIYECSLVQTNSLADNFYAALQEKSLLKQSFNFHFVAVPRVI